ncbi:MAG TPA: hypothetical protein VGJ15_06270, partial [Pirellulales bacterium]
ILSNAKVDQRSYVDTAKVGSLTIAAGVSVTLSYAGAGIPYTNGAFASLRSAVLYAFGVGTAIGESTPPGTYPVT